jgi:hypothetical protein
LSKRLYTEDLGEGQAINDSRVTVPEQFVGRESNFGQAIADLAHEWVHTFAEDAVHFSPATGSTEQRIEVGD